jgi:hypothetical protein
MACKYRLAIVPRRGRTALLDDDSVILIVFLFFFWDPYLSSTVVDILRETKVTSPITVYFDFYQLFPVYTFASVELIELLLFVFVHVVMLFPSFRHNNRKAHLESDFSPTEDKRRCKNRDRSGAPRATRLVVGTMFHNGTFVLSVGMINDD